MLLDKTLYNYYSADIGLTRTKAYTLKQLDGIDYVNKQIDFFKQRKITFQLDEAYIEYLSWYLPNYLEIYTTSKEFKNNFKPYKNQALHRIHNILFNPRAKTAKSMVLIFFISFVSPKLSKKLFLKFCPSETWKMRL